MLVIIDRFDKNNSVYLCDMCGTKLNVSEAIRITETQNNKNKKLYDLCSQCLKVIKKSVIRYRSKKR